MLHRSAALRQCGLGATLTVFVDNDVAVKLAQWGLLKRFGQHLIKQGNADVFMVATLRYRFKLDNPSKAAALLGSVAAASQLSEFAALCRPAKGHNASVAQALADVPAVDAGEATLFAAAAHYDAALVDTGDKNALRALGRLGAQHVAVRALTQKVACLEQTVQYLLGRWGFDDVSAALAAHPQVDMATHRCIHGKTQDEAIAALQEKIEQLRPHCAGILGAQPFAWVPI